MEKETKLTIKYDSLDAADMSKLISGADETDLRVMVALSMLTGKGGSTTVFEIAKLLKLKKTDIDGSLKYLRGAGVIDSEETGQTPVKRSETKATAHRGGAIEKSATLEGYSTLELAEIMETRHVSAEFVDEAQRIMGKIFRSYDTGILVGIVDRLGFEEEAVISMLHYAVGKGKRTMRYVETLAMAFYDDGITETAEVVERIEKMERSGEVISKIKQLYGIGERALSSTEKRLFSAWTETYAYDMDVIRMAYDITVDNTQKPIPKYANSILEHWHSEGLRTADDVRRYLERQDGGQTGNALKSYNADDFFEAALRRSFDELK